MTTLELRINLPDQLAREVQAAGLLKPEALEQLLRDAIRRKAVNELFAAADRLTGAEFTPMTLDEIQQEVDALRQQRKRRAADS